MDETIQCVGCHFGWPMISQDEDWIHRAPDGWEVYCNRDGGEPHITTAFVQLVTYAGGGCFDQLKLRPDDFKIETKETACKE